MIKIVVNICDATYEKLKFEAIEEKKNIPQLIKERIFHKPFTPQILEAYDKLIESEFNKFTED